MILLTLHRGLHTSNECQIGGLYSERGRFLCHVLEDPSRPFKRPGKTAIPGGVYSLEANTEQGRAERYGDAYRWHEHEIWHVPNVPNFELIQVHAGNYGTDTEGCLLPGVWDGHSNAVWRSVQTYKRLYQTYANHVRAGRMGLNIIDGNRDGWRA